MIKSMYLPYEIEKLIELLYLQIASQERRHEDQTILLLEIIANLQYLKTQKLNRNNYAK